MPGERPISASSVTVAAGAASPNVEHSPNIEHSPNVEPAPDATTPAMRLQMLSTEHWSLLASRGLAWTDTFSRTGMFLSTLSFAVVALALVAQASGFGDSFRLFALAILPVVLFLGIGTLLRLDSCNYQELLCVAGMNRIRALYLELSPDLERAFVMGADDDWPGIMRTMAVVPGRSNLVNHLAATPVQVAVLDAVLVAAIASLLALQLGTASQVAFGAGVVGFVAGLTLLLWLTQRTMAAANRSYHPRFPAAPAAGPE